MRVLIYLALFGSPPPNTQSYKHNFLQDHKFNNRAPVIVICTSVIDHDVRFQFELLSYFEIQNYGKTGIRSYNKQNCTHVVAYKSLNFIDFILPL